MSENGNLKRILFINTVTNNSTGRIMHDVQLKAEEEGISTLALVGRRQVYNDAPCEKYGNGISFWLHVGLTTIFDRHGFGSRYYTKRMIERIREFSPDVIHLHNIHGYYLNIDVLFRYLADEYKGAVIWTLHDLWPVTGHCPHFVAANCDKWKTGCSQCPNKRRYPISLIMDNSRRNYNDKRRLFTGVDRMCITVPSAWMRSKVEESFLGKYPVTITSNGINMDVFNYSRDDINITGAREKYGIPDNVKILLAIASQWDERKGLRDLMELSSCISDDYRIVIVGLNKRQINTLPDNVIGIARTSDVNELVALYSMAYVFINPSVEESFSLVTVEAQACGIPCIVLDTSAVKDLVDDNNGLVLHNHDASDYCGAIEQIEKRNYSKRDIRSYALQYDNSMMLASYMSLYKELLEINE